MLNDLDSAQRRLGYFHNTGYYVLEGEDFIKTFRLDAAPDSAFMPLFAEFVRSDRIIHRPLPELAELSNELLRRHLSFRPSSNPMLRFRERFERALSALQAGGLPYYHTWAFGTIRQAGAGFELAAEHLKWLQASGRPGLEPAIAAFAQLAYLAKTLILKAARAVNARRSFEGLALFDEMASAWQQGMEALAR